LFQTLSAEPTAQQVCLFRRPVPFDLPRLFVDIVEFPFGLSSRFILRTFVFLILKRSQDSNELVDRENENSRHDQSEGD
jgi:hypothetical protein